MEITGNNCIEVPIEDEVYWILVENESQFLYTMPLIFINKLQAQNNGLNLWRSESKVGKSTTVYLIGEIKNIEGINLESYPLIVGSKTLQPLTTSVTNISLF